MKRPAIFAAREASLAPVGLLHFANRPARRITTYRAHSEASARKSPIVILAHFTIIP